MATRRPRVKSYHYYRYVFTTARWKKPDAFTIQHLKPSCFLDPKSKKFPIRKENGGPIYMTAVRTAVHYAKMYGYKEVEKKAKRILELYAKAKEREKVRTKKTKRKKR